MPRVPRAQTETGRVQFTPAVAPGSQAALGQAVARALAPVQATLLEFSEREAVAKRKQALAVGLSDLTMSVSELQIQAENDPEIHGSSDRFFEAASASLDAVASSFDDDVVSDELRARGVRLIASTRASVASTEHNRFIGASTAALTNLTDNYVAAFVAAPNNVMAEEIEKNFNDAINSSDILDAAAKQRLRDRFAAQSSTAEAISAISANPSAALAALENNEFPGLTVVQRARFLDSALDEADRISRAAEQQAARAVKVREATKFDEVFDRVLDPEDDYSLESLRADLPSLSGADARSLRTIILSDAAAVDNPETLIEIEDAILADSPDALTKLQEALTNRNVKPDTFRSYRASIANRQGPDGSGYQQAQKVIVEGLMPGRLDRGKDIADLATRKANALAMLNDRVARGLPVTRAEGIQILGLFRSTEPLDALSAMPRPFGFVGLQQDITPEVVQQSQADMDEALAEGRITPEEYRFQLETIIVPLRELTRRIEESRQLTAGGGQ